MGIIRAFLIFGLVTPILSFNLITESKCSVYKTFVRKYNFKNAVLCKDIKILI